MHTITYLNLSTNNIFEEGLIVRTSYLIRKGIKSIAALLIKNNHSLTELNLSSNSFGNNGVRAIAEVLPTSTISHLKLANVDIDDVGASDCALVIPISKIQVLDLSENRIADAGGQQLAETIKQSPQLTELYLSRNSLSDVAVLARAAITNPLLSVLDLQENPLNDTTDEATTTLVNADILYI
jgi:Ran GTPase-activating protein (RanGAP) involved in mRNA processing and transport